MKEVPQKKQRKQVCAQKTVKHPVARGRLKLDREGKMDYLIVIKQLLLSGTLIASSFHHKKVNSYIIQGFLHQSDCE